MKGWKTEVNHRGRFFDPGPDTDSHGAESWSRAPLWIVTDLDGTLLDERYDFAPARPALAALSLAGAKLVLASSKTRAEMEPLAAGLGLRPALIVENGGATLVPAAGGAYEVVASDIPHLRLRQALDEIACETGAVLAGFSALGLERVVQLTGLRSGAARLALEREYDEPFVLADPARAAEVIAAAERRGLRVSRGGRFFHLSGPFDKGDALGRLLARFGPPPLVAGLGDAPNDLSFLRMADRPILIPRPGGTIDPALSAALPWAEAAAAPGPAGWGPAVLGLLARAQLPAASSPRSLPVR